MRNFRPPNVDGHTSFDYKNGARLQWLGLQQQNIPLNPNPAVTKHFWSSVRTAEAAAAGLWGEGRRKGFQSSRENPSN